MLLYMNKVVATRGFGGGRNAQIAGPVTTAKINPMPIASQSRRRMANNKWTGENTGSSR